ncbi:RNA-binding cell elongation regulator Jag/EloR [Marinococcus halophilus]|uniref:RNA-binding protein KhpB n=1 Tax=Marinococcus halophilus TaxID=1371 RepID=A0A510Y8F6_MARHA|nr:RNA-binding cell elongation regulator Jag/EloR [Marinococcus halophilus]GEK59646.1 Jag protein [Marinococcus halophilus]
MNQSMKISGKTIEEALDKAVQEWGTTIDRIEYQVLEEPRKGFLGIGARQAYVEVSVRVDPVEEAAAYLKDVVQAMNVEAEVEVKISRKLISMELEGNSLGLLIGKRGKTLDALQHLTNTVANKHANAKQHIVLDAENYRQNRKESLQRFAERMAGKARREAITIKLEPMDAAERKIVHQTLHRHPDIETTSTGKEPRRHVVITPAAKENPK